MPRAAGNARWSSCTGHTRPVRIPPLTGHTVLIKESRMIETLRRRAKENKGFTLIELLVVVIVIGLLAAIAMPAFLGQRDKASDASAKSLLRNGATALEAYFADGETYAGADATNLGAIEPNVAWVAAGAAAAAKSDQVELAVVGADEYELKTTSASGTAFSYKKDMSPAAGAATVERTCGAGCTW
ncbi:MAG: prepilin-type N-terminal cleavage/methylation domain-containing protein [Actinomycetota bacterium]